MNLLIVDSFHHKNQIGLNMIMKELNINYKYGNMNDIENYDVIYSPINPIDTSKYPNKKFIFGPHFSVFPDNKLLNINNVHKNSVYIQPSDWARDVWINKGAGTILPIKSFPFPVEIEKFKPLNFFEEAERKNVFIMYKQRNLDDLKVIINFLHNNITYRIFNYTKRYDENDYINYLQTCKYGIWIGRHESQGFALEEALAMNVPLLVWETTTMSQETSSPQSYINVFGSVIPYWDVRCGEYFYTKETFEATFNTFISNIATYKPREYIIENLNTAKCAERFTELLNSFNM